MKSTVKNNRVVWSLAIYDQLFVITHLNGWAKTIMQDNRAKVTGVVLAGGRARRMANKDKGLIQYRGQPLVRRAIDALAPSVGQISHQRQPKPRYLFTFWVSGRFGFDRYLRWTFGWHFELFEKLSIHPICYRYRVIAL